MTYPAEWLRGLCGHTRAELQAIIDDEKEPASRQAAARQILAAADGDTRAFAEICDRTGGRPVQAVLNVTADVADLGAMLVEAQRLAGLPVVDAPQLPTTVEAEEATDDDGQEDQ